MTTQTSNLVVGIDGTKAKSGAAALEVELARLKASGDSVTASTNASSAALNDNAAAVQALLGRIDPAQKKLADLDAMETELNRLYKAGAVEADTYAAATAKLAEARAANSIENEAAGAAKLSEILAKLGPSSSYAAREYGVLIGELARGNYGRLNGSLISLTSRTGLLGLAFSSTGLAIAGTAGVLAALGVAFVQGAEHEKEFNDALLLTGNYSGQTVDSLNVMTKALADNNQQTSASRLALASAAASGRFTADQLEAVAAGAVAMKDLTGAAIDKTVSEFKKLDADPVKALADLDAQYHFLTPDVYAHVIALQKQGDVTDAATLAIHTFSSTLTDRAKQADTDLTSLGRTVDSVMHDAGSMWDAISGGVYGMFHKSSLQDQLTQAQAALAALKSGASSVALGGAVSGNEDQIKQRIADLQKQIALNSALADVEGKQADTTSTLIQKLEKEYEARHKLATVSAADREIQTLQKQIALTGDLTTAERVRIGIEEGYYGAVTPAQATELANLAGRIDRYNALVKEMGDVSKAQQKMAEEGKRVWEETRTPAEKYTADLKQLHDLYNAQAIDADTLSRAMVAANDRYEKSLSDATKQAQNNFHDMNYFAQQAAHGIESDFANFLLNPLNEGFDGLAASFAKTLANMAAQAAASSILTAIARSASTSSYGWIASLGSSLLGSGHAVGGAVQPGILYPVNERGPEVLTYNGRDYLMGGAHGGYVSPNESKAPTAPQIGNISVVVNNDGSGDVNSQTQLGRQIGTGIRSAVLKVLVEQQRPGGVLAHG